MKQSGSLDPLQWPDFGCLAIASNVIFSKWMVDSASLNEEKELHIVHNAIDKAKMIKEKMLFIKDITIGFLMALGTWLIVMAIFSGLTIVFIAMISGV